jgi:NAD(P) transhydrogenase subunit alpha
MIIGIPKEVVAGETRVAATPETVGKLSRQGLEIIVERGAGEASGLADADYETKGATLESDAQAIWSKADAIIKVQSPAQHSDSETHEIELLGEGKVFISLLNPLGNHETIQKLADRKVTAFALEMVPRITRAQSMDVLSSMSSVGGYKAVLLAANALPKMFPLMMTAAGTIPPAKVFVIGAGVAGLAAIAAAKRLGAVVSAYDTRPVVKEQVESLGAKFVQIDLGASGEGQGGYARELTDEEKEKQQQLMAETVIASDVVITTALVPGRPAPMLIPEDVVKKMKSGAVIVDMAAETGGNCALTEPGEQVVKEGVTICGQLNLPATLPVDASAMFARNVATFVQALVKDGELALDFDDEIIQGSLMTYDGGIINERVAGAMGVDAAPMPSNDTTEEADGENDEDSEEEPAEEEADESAEDETAEVESDEDDAGDDEASDDEEAAADDEDKKVETKTES